MNLALWIVAGLLAAVFLPAGSNTLVTPREKLAKALGGGWVLDFSAASSRLSDRSRSWASEALVILL